MFRLSIKETQKCTYKFVHKKTDNPYAMASYCKK